MRLDESWTNNGRVLPKNNYVSNEKLAEANKIIGGIINGSQRAVLDFKEHMGFTETQTTGDEFIWNFGQILGITVDQQLVNTPESDAFGIIETVTQSDFDNIVNYTLTPVETSIAAGNSIEPNRPANVLPIVPEDAPYPHFTLTASGAVKGISQAKRGARYDISLEKIIKDAANIVPMLPGLIANQFDDTIQWDAWGAITAAIADGQSLAAATTLDGTQVPANAPLSRAAVSAAVRQLKTTKKNVGTRYEDYIDVSTFTLLVPLGSADAARFALYGQNLISRDVPNGTATDRFSLDTVLYDFSNSITSIVETKYVTGNSWALVPTKGSTREPFATYNKLRGFEAPEIRVSGASFAGQRLSGNQPSSIFGDTSFDTDSASIRGRLFGKPAVFHPEYTLHSTGAGA